MKRRPRKLLVADLFCGAGGSSEGARRALLRLDREMILTCVNHWDRAIETHSRMHPKARHYCQDIASVRPHLVVPEGYLDLLLASPTCTYHSRARGGRPTSDQQRMDPWHIIPWVTELRVKRVLIENVTEFVKWGPVDRRSGKPIKSREGEYFRQWLATLAGLGFAYEWRFLNCADFGDATTRIRFFLQARSDGKPIVWPAPTHSRDGSAGRRWKPARDIIDWSLKGRSIFNRPKPLAAKTLRRIHAGALKENWPAPFLVILRNHMTAQGIEYPLPAMTAGGTHIGLATPVLVTVAHGDSARERDPAWRRARSVEQPLPAMTAGGGQFGVADPVILPQRSSQAPRSAGEPVPTITTVARVAMAQPFVLAQASGGAGRAVSEPVPTIVQAGAVSLISPYYGSGSGETCKPVSEPLDTVTTRERFALVVTVTHGGGEERHHSPDRPLPTLTCAARGELAVITAAFGEREGQAPRVHSVEAPTPTICAQGRINLAEGVMVGGQRYDILYRMLQPRELARAMSFSDAEYEYEFVGTKTEITRQIGNAVPVETATALIGAAFSDLSPARLREAMGLPGDYDAARPGMAAE